MIDTRSRALHAAQNEHDRARAGSTWAARLAMAAVSSLREMARLRRMLAACLVVALTLLTFAVAVKADDKGTLPTTRPPAPTKVESAVPEAETATEQWYVLLIEGKRAGWLMSRQLRKGDAITSLSEMNIQMKRGAMTIKLAMTSEFVETTEGKPVKLVSTQSFGAAAMKVEKFYGEKDVRTVRSQMGQKSEDVAPLPAGEWLTPAAAERFMEKELAAGKTEITARILDITSGDEPMLMKRRLVERTVTQALGRDVPALKFAVTVEKFPNVELTEYTDERGVSIRSTADLGVIKMEQILADKDLAMSKLDAPELMIATLVKPDKPITRSHTRTKGVYLLSVPPTPPAIDLPATAGQRVERIDDHTLRVTVEPAQREAAKLTPEERRELLAASPMLRHNDPVIAEMLKTADKPGAPAAERAEALRLFVNRYIKAKDLSVGFASASETARTRTGDCTEHGVLLAAMLRGAGYPARVVSGLIYTEQVENTRNVFGYHMWAQALLPQGDGTERWVNLDATLPEGMLYDATHIAIETSPLSGTATENLMVRTVPLMGRLKIKVEEIK